MTLQEVRTWLELAYFVATIAMAIAAWRALTQIRLGKRSLELAQRDLQTRSRREAIMLANDICAKFGQDLVKQSGDVINHLNSKGIGVYLWEMRDAEFTPDSIIRRGEADNWLAPLFADLNAGIEIVKLLNNLEGTAMPFVTCVADEEVAYPVIGRIFMDLVRAHGPYLIALRHSQVPLVGSGRFENTVKLFQQWYARAGTAALDQDAKDLQDRKQKLPKLKPMKPIGTD